MFKKEFDEMLFYQISKHYFSGLITATINFFLFNFIFYYSKNTTLSNTLTAIVVVTVSFFIQKYFTYKPNYNSLWQPLLFLINAFIYYLFDTFTLLLLIDKLLINPLMAKLITIIMLSPLSFSFQKFIVFKLKKPPNEK